MGRRFTVALWLGCIFGGERGIRTREAIHEITRIRFQIGHLRPLGQLSMESGARCRTRICGPSVRSRVLYPTELNGHDGAGPQSRTARLRITKSALYQMS